MLSPRAGLRVRPEMGVGGCGDTVEGEGEGEGEGKGKGEGEAED